MTKPIQNLLVIDDDEIDQMMYARIIKRTGLVENTIQYHAADDALDFITSGDCPAIDAIILDINMPRMDGFEFLDALGEHADGTSIQAVIVMLTTSLDPDDEAKARRSPLVKEFFYKPLIEDHLRTITQMVAGQQGGRS